MMKYFRACLVGFLVVCVADVFSGCATAGRDPAASAEGMGWAEKKKSSPTDNLNAAEKTGYYLGWLVLDLIYGAAAANSPSDP